MGLYDASTPIRQLPDWAVSDLDIETINNMSLEVFERLEYMERCAVQRIAPDRYAKLVEAEKAQTAQKRF